VQSFHQVFYIGFDETFARFLIALSWGFPGQYIIRRDYIRMHGLMQTMIMDMLKKAKVWAIREPQHMFHGLVPREYLRRYCEEQRTTKEFIIPHIMTQDHSCKQING